jgi:hypothetical protein
MQTSCLRSSREVVALRTHWCHRVPHVSMLKFVDQFGAMRCRLCQQAGLRHFKASPLDDELVSGA